MTMTKNEAVDWLKWLMEGFDEEDPEMEPCKEAVLMAIETLEGADEEEKVDRLMGEYISRRDAIDLLEAYTQTNTLGHTPKQIVEALPSVQPNKDVIDDCIYNIKANLSAHTSSWGMTEINYYIDKMYEEIFGEPFRKKVESDG